ncbi:MAG: HlyD family secretion protein [Actinomycetota bacterium]|nr:HlyD family secretion protein [Actinomycetota bacterium]
MTDIQKPDIRGEAETHNGEGTAGPSRSERPEAPLKATGSPGGAPATSNGNGVAAPPAATVPAPLPEGEGPHGQAVVVAEPIPPIRRLPPYAERDRRTRREMIVTTLIAVIGVGVLIATALYVFTNPPAWPGTLRPAAQVDLNFARSGTIVAVLVKAGDHVKRGDVLARQDDVAVNLGVSAAEATLAADQARLAAVGTPAGSTPDPRVQASLDKARKQLEAAAAAASGSQQSADLALNVAQQDLTNAQADQARDQGTFGADCPQGAGGSLAPGFPAGTPNCPAQADQVARDAEAVTRAQLHVQQQQQASQQARQAASQSQTLAQSEISLAQASVPPTGNAATPQDIAALRAQIAADDASVASQHAAAQQAVLTAPMDGVVAGVDAVPGDFAGQDGVRTYNRSVTPANQPFSLLAPSTSGSGSPPQTSFVPVVQIYGTDGWLVVAQVGEHDALRAHEGQRADVRLDGVGKHKFPGRVTQVIGQPLRSAGSVVYNVVLKLDTVPMRVLPGMSASVFLHP